MHIQSKCHDGEGTDASLHAFLNDHRRAAPAMIRRSASRDIGATVQRLRDRGIEPPLVAAVHDASETTLVRTLMICVTAGLALWVAIGLIAAHLMGRI